MLLSLMTRCRSGPRSEQGSGALSLTRHQRSRSHGFIPNTPYEFCEEERFSKMRSGGLPGEFPRDQFLGFWSQSRDVGNDVLAECLTRNSSSVSYSPVKSRTLSLNEEHRHSSAPMTIPAHRFRAADDTNPDFPSATAWTIEEWSEADGRWKQHLVQNMPVHRPTRERVQELVDRLNRGEDISEFQRRGPGTTSWKRPI